MGQISDANASPRHANAPKGMPMRKPPIRSMILFVANVESATVRNTVSQHRSTKAYEPATGMTLDEQDKEDVDV